MQRKKSTVQDYVVEGKLGKGSYGEVFKVRKDNNVYALKKVSKQLLCKENKAYQSYVEKEILSKLSHPGLITLSDTFSDAENIFFVLELCELGEYARILSFHTLLQQTRRHHVAQMVSVLQYLRKSHITHRDFKSSNLLLTNSGHLKLTDFGSAYAPPDFLGPDLFERIQKMRAQEIDKNTNDRRATFVGTPFYMSPELLSDQRCGPSADLWALGCIIYQMYTGSPPFADVDEYSLFKKIKEEEVAIPETLPDDARDLVSKLLVKDPKKRLGCGPEGSDMSFEKGLKHHAFFVGIDWEKLFEAEVPGISQLKKSIQESNAKKNEIKYLMKGIVSKKMWFGNYKDRLLALVLEGKQVRLGYFDEESGEKKGQIVLNMETPVELDGNKFTVTNEKKTYFFKSKKPEHPYSAQEWVSKIKQAITNAYY